MRVGFSCRDKLHEGGRGGSLSAYTTATFKRAIDRGNDPRAKRSQKGGNGQLTSLTASRNSPSSLDKSA